MSLLLLLKRRARGTPTPDATFVVYGRAPDYSVFGGGWLVVPVAPQHALSSESSAFNIVASPVKVTPC